MFSIIVITKRTVVASSLSSEKIGVALAAYRGLHLHVKVVSLAEKERYEYSYNPSPQLS